MVLLTVLELVAKGHEDDGGGGAVGFLFIAIVVMFMWSVFFGGKNKTKK